MRTFTYLTIVILLATACSTSVVELSDDTASELFNIDPIIKPDYKYKIQSILENSTNMVFDSLIDPNVRVEMAMLENSGSKIYFESTMITSIQDDVITYELTIDDLYHDMELGSAQEFPGMQDFLDEQKEELKKRINEKSYGHAIDARKLEIDSSTHEATSEYDIATSKGVIENIWNSQFNLPHKAMRIGEVYTWKEAVIEENIKTKKIDSLFKGEKVKPNRFADVSKAIKQEKESHSIEYTLIRVENNIAFFEFIEQKGYDTGKLISQTEGLGILEYDLIHQHYRKVEKEVTSNSYNKSGKSGYVKITSTSKEIKEIFSSPLEAQGH